MLRRVGLIVLLVVGSLSVAPAGAPVQLSYVYSDSMEPTIGVDDGYLIVPAGEVGSGDIVTFWSPEKETYVTHRIIGRSEDGFITKGDNNPSTDQAAGFSAVTKHEIVGTVLTFDGGPVLIPYLGIGVHMLQKHLLLVSGGFVGLILYSARVGSTPTRDVTRVSHVFQPILLVCFLSITGLLAYGGSGHEVTLVAVSSTGLSDAPNVVTVGSSEPIEFTVTQEAWPFMTRVVETNGMMVTTEARNATAISVNGSVTPPASTGPMSVGVSVNQYPAIIPRPVLVYLQALHPAVASGASAAVTLAPLWACYRLLLDPHTALRQRPARWRTTLRRNSK